MSHLTRVHRLLTTAIALASMLHVSVAANAQDPTGRFVYQPDGTLDTTTGILWGFGLIEAFGMSAGHDYAIFVAEELYPDFSASFVESTYGLPCDEHFFTDWRLPTRDEMVDAVNAGLSVWHNRDPNLPNDSKLEPREGGPGHWTSTTTGKKTKGGYKTVYVVQSWTAEVLIVSEYSALNCLFVRGGADEPIDSGPGNGKGKKK